MHISEIKEKIDLYKKDLSNLLEPAQSVKDLQTNMENEIRVAEARNLEEFESSETIRRNKEKSTYDSKIHKAIDSIERESVGGFQGLDKINEVLEKMSSSYSPLIEAENIGVLFENEEDLIKQLEAYSDYYTEGNYSSTYVDFTNMKEISIVLLVLMLLAGRIISPIISAALIVISAVIYILSIVEGRRYKNTFILKNTIEKRNLEISEINLLKEKEYNNKIEEVKNSFPKFEFIPSNYVPFNSTKIKEKYNMQISGVKKEYLSQLAEYEKTRDKYIDRIKELEVRLREEESKLISEIYTYNTSKLLKIYDVDFPINEDLDMFRENEKSSIIVYEDREEIIEMLQMTIFQICKLMHPTVIEINIVDLLNICQDFVMFELPFVNLITNNEELQKYITKEDTDIQEDMRKVLKISDNINEYNRIKLEEGSVPVKYKFTFIYEANEQFLKSELLKRALRNGSKTGHIFMLVFDMVKFLSMPEVDKEYLTLFEETENIFSYLDRKLSLDDNIYKNFKFKV